MTLKTILNHSNNIIILYKCIPFLSTYHADKPLSSRWMPMAFTLRDLSKDGFLRTRPWSSARLYAPQLPSCLLRSLREAAAQELLPGTHIKPSEASEDEEGLLCAGPAGTLAIHHQSIVHRRAPTGEARGASRCQGMISLVERDRAVA